VADGEEDSSGNGDALGVVGLINRTSCSDSSPCSNDVVIWLGYRGALSQEERSK